MYSKGEKRNYRQRGSETINNAGIPIWKIGNISEARFVLVLKHCNDTDQRNSYLSSDEAASFFFIKEIGTSRS